MRSAQGAGTSVSDAMGGLFLVLSSVGGRRAIQILAIPALGLAIVVLTTELGRQGLVVGLLLGTFLFISLKLSLVSLVRSNHSATAKEVRALERDVLSIGSRLELLKRRLDLIELANTRLESDVSTELSSLLDRCEQVEQGLVRVVQEVEAKNQIVVEELEHFGGIARRFEPSVAGFAVLRHEVAYLREALVRLQGEGQGP